MISISGFELPSPPLTAKEIRQWGKWIEEINMLEAAHLKRKTALGKKKSKNVKKKRNKKDGA